MSMTRSVNGRTIEMSAQEDAEIRAEWAANKAIALANAYKADRAAAHLPIQDQLDMLYWDKANGTELWRDYVAEIKTRIPKPV